MTVRFSPQARAQLIAARDYIRTHNPIAARTFRDKVDRRLRQLGNFPQLGHSIPEFPESSHRQLIIDPYRFFYRVDGETVWIVAVWHGKQIPTQPGGPT
jgi:toxin ParE1/3/4